MGPFFSMSILTAHSDNSHQRRGLTAPVSLDEPKILRLTTLADRSLFNCGGGLLPRHEPYNRSVNTFSGQKPSALLLRVMGVRVATNPCSTIT